MRSAPRGVRGSGKGRPEPFNPAANRSLGAAQKAARPFRPVRPLGESAPQELAEKDYQQPAASAAALNAPVDVPLTASLHEPAQSPQELPARKPARPKASAAAKAEATSESSVPQVPEASVVHEETPVAAEAPPAKRRTSKIAASATVAAEVAHAPEHDGPTLPGFADLGLSETLYDTVVKAGFETPTPIQARSIPILLGGRDLIGQAQTGTGKTAAFALPLLDLIDRSDSSVQGIVLAPTRELAVQVASGIHGFSAGTGVRTAAVYGGQPIDRQFRALRDGAHIVVGTPGRVLDHIRRGTLSLSSVKLCVLDEADEMLALGFLEEVESVLKELPPDHQTALFSATFSARVQVLAKTFMHSPETVSIESRRRTVDTTKQTYYDVPHGKKQDALARVLDMESPGPTIVFCRTRMETDQLAESLRLRGYGAEALHGDMGQPERERVLRRFREGQADLLVATDVAARGLDIDSVTHVINYDIPWDVEQYIHRVGRTGRAGRAGDAITLVTPRERRQLTFIEQAIGVKMTPARVPTTADIAARRRSRFQEALVEALTAGEYEGYLSVVGDLAEEYDSSDIAAAALKMLWKYWAANAGPIDEEAAAETSTAAVGMARLFMGIGKQDGLRPADVVGALTREIGMDGRRIGAIDILDRTAFVEVPTEEAQDVINALRKTRIRNRKVTVQFAGPDRGGQERF